MAESWVSVGVLSRGPMPKLAYPLEPRPVGRAVMIICQLGRAMVPSHVVTQQPRWHCKGILYV